jgi:pilus assembly protein CpaC
MKKLITLSLCCCLVLFGGMLRAEELTEEMVISVGMIQTIPVSSVKRIAIGNPNIADVTSAKESELTILGKLPGSTTLIVWDNFGEQKYGLTVTPGDMVEVKNRIDRMLKTLEMPSVNTKIENKEGKVLLLGNVKTSREKERLAIALASLQDRIVDLIEVKEEEAMVEIDVQVLELNNDATKTLGLTWPSSVNIYEIGSPALQAMGTSPSTLFKVLNLGRANASGVADPFTLKLDALIQEGKAKILSRPRLACQSGKEAELLVGGEKPLFTTQVVTGGGQGTSIEYKEYGIKLKVKPTVAEGERVKLGLNVEVSEVGTADSIGSAANTTAKAYPLAIS